MAEETYMRQAISAAREGILQGQTPFGACIEFEGKVLSARHNEVWARTDITAHAEILAIRDACHKLGRVDLSGSVIYSTCEPCPMCFSACHWARISLIRFGADIAEAQKAGFNEICFSNQQMKSHGGSSLEIEGGLLKEECAELFRFWLEKKLSRPY